MNPLLKHPILQFIGYEMMKKPTLEGIKADIKKEQNKGKLGRIVLPLLFVLQSIYHIIFGRISWSLVELILGIIAYLTLHWDGKRYKKRFKISDEEILEQIEIHKKWNNNKSQ